MTSDPIRGHTLRWTFDDGQMKGKAFEHTFSIDGTVSWRMMDAPKAESAKAAESPPKAHYEQASVSPDVHAISYLGDSGYTLTVMLDFRTGNLVAFASNEKQLTLQHGHFEVVRRAA